MSKHMKGLKVYPLHLLVFTYKIDWWADDIQPILLGLWSMCYILLVWGTRHKILFHLRFEVDCCQGKYLGKMGTSNNVGLGFFFFPSVFVPKLHKTSGPAMPAAARLSALSLEMSSAVIKHRHDNQTATKSTSLAKSQRGESAGY